MKKKADGTPFTNKDKADGTEIVEDKTNAFVDVWTNLYNGKTRVFSTTAGHNDDTVADARYLDLVTRGSPLGLRQTGRGRQAQGFGYGPGGK